MISSSTHADTTTWIYKRLSVRDTCSECHLTASIHNFLRCIRKGGSLASISEPLSILCISGFFFFFLSFFRETVLLLFFSSSSCLSLLSLLLSLLLSFSPGPKAINLSFVSPLKHLLLSSLTTEKIRLKSRKYYIVHLRSSFLRMWRHLNPSPHRYGSPICLWAPADVSIGL